MPYTIKQAAELTNLTPVTLQYYDKQGLLPFMERRESGYRMFSDGDIAMLLCPLLLPAQQNARRRCAARSSD